VLRNLDHSFFWSNGAMTDLGTLGSGLDSQGVAINDSGEVVGGSSGLYRFRTLRRAEPLVHVAGLVTVRWE
jgi:uncharacterized membrane protein